MSGNKGKSLALAESSSTNSSAEEGYRNKEIVQAEQVKLLDKRLRILEDETELLKVAFYEGVEERRKLVHAIQNEFQAVNHFRCLEEHTFGYTKVLNDSEVIDVRKENMIILLLQLKLIASIELHIIGLWYFLLEYTASTTWTPANSR